MMKSLFFQTMLFAGLLSQPLLAQTGFTKAYHNNDGLITAQCILIDKNDNTYIPGGNGTAGTLTKLDALGNIVFAKRFGDQMNGQGFNNKFINGIFATDSNLVIVGKLNDSIASVLKLDRDGNQIWNAAIVLGVHYEYTADLVEMPDSNFMAIFSSG